jgi:hypothetical protein
MARWNYQPGSAIEFTGGARHSASMAAWSAGRAMTLDQAIAKALGTTTYKR